jgi:hypothetical protein
VYRDYAPRGVRFYCVYKSLMHPERDGYVQPYTLAERLLHVQEAQRRLGTQIPWLCDEMSNEFKHAMGEAPNSEFVIDPQGHIVVRRIWSQPELLREDLERLVGRVKSPTQDTDADLHILPPPGVAAQGQLKRLQPPGPMSAVRIEPQTSQEPY